MSIRLKMFGHLQIVKDNSTSKPVKRCRALLGYLALDIGRASRRRTVASELWPDSDIKHSLNSLSKAIRVLKTELGEDESVFMDSGEDIWLDEDLVETDVAEFKRLIREFDDDRRTGTEPPFPDECFLTLVEAAHLYSDHFLVGIDDTWARYEREELLDEYCVTLDLIVAHLMCLKQYHNALHYAHLFVRAAPTEEKSHLSLMKLYSSLGLHNAALSQVERMKDALAVAGVPLSVACQDYAKQIHRSLAGGVTGSPASILEAERPMTFDGA